MQPRGFPKPKAIYSSQIRFLDSPNLNKLKLYPNYSTEQRGMGFKSIFHLRIKSNRQDNLNQHCALSASVGTINCN